MYACCNTGGSNLILEVKKKIVHFEFSPEWLQDIFIFSLVFMRKVLLYASSELFKVKRWRVIILFTFSSYIVNNDLAVWSCSKECTIHINTNRRVWSKTIICFRFCGFQSAFSTSCLTGTRWRHGVPPMVLAFCVCFLLVTSVTYGDDDDIPPPVWY